MLRGNPHLFGQCFTGPFLVAVQAFCLFGVRCWLVVHGLKHGFVGVIKGCCRLEHPPVLVLGNRDERRMLFHWHPKAERVAFVFHRASGQQGGVDWNLLTEVGQTVRLLTHGFNAQTQVNMTVPRQGCEPSTENIVAK